MASSHTARSKSTATVIYDLDGKLVSNVEKARDDKTIAEIIAADMKTLDSQPNTQPSKKINYTTWTTTPVPKLFSDAIISTPSETTSTLLIPTELRSITLDCLGGDVIAETAEETTYPYTNSARPFSFVNQTDLPVTALLRHVVR